MLVSAIFLFSSVALVSAVEGEADGSVSANVWCEGVKACPESEYACIVESASTNVGSDHECLRCNEGYKVKQTESSTADSRTCRLCECIPEAPKCPDGTSYADVADTRLHVHDGKCVRQKCTDTGKWHTFEVYTPECREGYSPDDHNPCVCVADPVEDTCEPCPETFAPKECGERGVKIDREGCSTCECVSDSCEDVHVPNCDKPAVDPATGCTTGECEGCIDVDCGDRVCEFGFHHRSNGCKTCECKPDPNECPSIHETSDASYATYGCNIRCEFGFARDDEGCEICECDKECPPEPQCLIACPNGYVYDDNNCKTCRCAKEKCTVDSTMYEAGDYDYDYEAEGGVKVEKRVDGSLDVSIGGVVTSTCGQTCECTSTGEIKCSPLTCPLPTRPPNCPADLMYMRRDDCGCPVYACQKECDEVTCDLACENGFKHNEDGCKICECRDETVCPTKEECLKRQAHGDAITEDSANSLYEYDTDRLFCPYGFRECSCECRKLPPLCPEADELRALNASQICAYGFVTDDNGCRQPICKKPEDECRSELLRCPDTTCSQYGTDATGCSTCNTCVADECRPRVMCYAEKYVACEFDEEAEVTTQVIKDCECGEWSNDCDSIHAEVSGSSASATLIADISTDRCVRCRKCSAAGITQVQVAPCPIVVTFPDGCDALAVKLAEGERQCKVEAVDETNTECSLDCRNRGIYVTDDGDDGVVESEAEFAAGLSAQLNELGATEVSNDDEPSSASCLRSPLSYFM
jgi:hypothetical protein